MATPIPAKAVLEFTPRPRTLPSGSAADVPPRGRCTGLKRRAGREAAGAAGPHPGGCAETPTLAAHALGEHEQSSSRKAGLCAGLEALRVGRAHGRRQADDAGGGLRSAGQRTRATGDLTVVACSLCRHGTWPATSRRARVVGVRWNSAGAERRKPPVRRQGTPQQCRRCGS